MKFSQTSTLVVAAAVLVTGANLLVIDGRAAADNRKQPRTETEQKALAEFMHAKLDASEQILEGLVTEDFAMIEKGAAQLEKMSQAEQWRVSNDAMYRQYSAEFRRVAGQLKKRAGEKKLEGAALSWLETTMSCIECHRHVRAMLIADGGAAPPALDDEADRELLTLLHRSRALDAR